MRHRELVPTFKQIIQEIPSLDFHKSLLFVKPLGGVLRGIDFDPSGYNKHDFEVAAFLMPLCYPTDHYHMTFGRRVNYPRVSWSMQMPDLASRLVEHIKEQAMPFLSTAPTLKDLVPALRPYRGCHARKSAAYALARIGENQEAIAMIEDYLPTLDLTSHWQKKIADDSRALRHLLLYEPALAAAKLEGWETETIRNLGL